MRASGLGVPLSRLPRARRVVEFTVSGAEKRYNLRFTREGGE